jgi:hypothetical protein
VTSRAAPTNVTSKQLTFSYSVALKEQRHPLLVLRHQSRLPTTSTSFVEKVGERVFIFASVTSELDDHSLVFFHRDREIRAGARLHVQCRNLTQE